MENNKDVYEESQNPLQMELSFSEIKALQVLQTPTDTNWISTKEIGGKTLSYVSGNIVTRILNKAFNYRWSFEIKETRIVQSQDFAKKDYKTKVVTNIPQGSVVQVLGRMTVPGWGVREQWGAQVLTGGSDVQEHSYKSAATDSMKKCASLFGVNLDIYGNEDVQTIRKLNVTPEDLVFSDEDYLDDYLERKAKAIKKRKEDKQKENQEKIEKHEDSKAVEAPASSVQSEINAQQSSPEEIKEIVTQAKKTEDVPETPTVDNAPVPPGGYWDPNDIARLKKLKEDLQLEDNSGLDIFAKEFFNDPNATYLQINKQTLKDFLHYMDTRL